MATIRRVRTIFNGVAGTPWYSNLYFTDQYEASEYNGAVGDLWTSYDELLTVPVTWATDSTVVDIDTATGQPTGTTAVTPVTGAGTNPTDPLPYATQAVATLRTGHYANGREVRGRLFLPGLGENSTSAGLFNNTDVASMAEWVEDLRTATVIADNFWVVYSPKAGAAFPVTGTSVSRKPGVLRSRRD